MSRKLLPSALALLGVLLVPSWPVQFMCFLYLAVTAVCAGYSRLLRRGIAVTRVRPEARCFAGADVDLGLEVSNRSVVPATSLLVTDRQGALRALVPLAFAMHVPARASRRVSYQLRSVERGVCEVGPVSVAGSDPLGLFPFVCGSDDRVKVVVYPALRSVAPRADSGLPGGSACTSDPAYEDTGRFRAVREYVRGDDTRRIHWKVSARRGALHVLEFDRSVESAQLVVLDLCVQHYPLRYRHERTELAVVIAATLIREAARRGQKVGLCSTGLVDGRAPCVLPGPCRGVSPHLLELLARIMPSDSDTDLADELASRALVLPAGARVSVVGPPGLDAARLKAAVRGATSFAIYQVGGPVGRSPVPRGVRVVAVETAGEELPRA